jgi:hypothetical protein
VAAGALGDRDGGAMNCGCWLPDVWLTAWERHILDAYTTPATASSGQRYWDLDLLPPVAIKALCWPRRAAIPAQLATATGTEGR